MPNALSLVWAYVWPALQSHGCTPPTLLDRSLPLCSAMASSYFLHGLMTLWLYVCFIWFFRLWAPWGQGHVLLKPVFQHLPQCLICNCYSSHAVELLKIHDHFHPCYKNIQVVYKNNSFSGSKKNNVILFLCVLLVMWTFNAFMFIWVMSLRVYKHRHSMFCLFLKINITQRSPEITFWLYNFGMIKGIKFIIMAVDNFINTRLRVLSAWWNKT